MRFYCSEGLKSVLVCVCVSMCLCASCLSACLPVGAVGEDPGAALSSLSLVYLSLFRERKATGHRPGKWGNWNTACCSCGGGGRGRRKGLELQPEKRAFSLPRTLTADMGTQHGWGH